MSSNIENSQINYERDSLTKIISTALSQKHVSGLVNVLDVIANSVKAYACILWKLEPNIDLTDKEVQKGARLFVLAGYHCKQNESEITKRRTIPLDYINLVGSANGKAILEGKEQIIENVKIDASVQPVEWINRDNLTSMIAIPITNDEFDEFSNTTLAIYRNDKINPFSTIDVNLLKQMAELIMPLYQAIQNKVEKKLLEAINKIIDETEKKEKIQEDLANERKKVLESLSNICEEIKANFQCVEVSVFLRKETTSKIIFSLHATTCPEWSEERNTEYQPSEQEGLTGWVLKNKEPLQIFDLGNFDEEKTKLEKRDSKYKNLGWKDSFNVKNLARLKLNIPPDQNLPPLNFVAVPILRENEILGVIRCSVATKAPWFFIDRQKLLVRVASQISRFWDKWLQHFAEKRENTEWRKLFAKINLLNNEVQESLINASLTKKDLYKRIIGITEEIIQGADIVDIMLFDETHQEIYFADVGEKWTSTISKRELKRKKKTRFSLYNHPINSLIEVASNLYSNPEVKVINSLEKLGMTSSVFPETRRIIIAPIRHEEKPDGLLAIRITKENINFTSYAHYMAELLGQQLGLYLSLLKHENQQSQAFENLFHQLKSPVGQLFIRTQGLLHKVVGDITYEEIEKLDEIDRELLVLRGLSRKAKTVADNSGIFTELATKEKLFISRINLRRLSNISNNENYNLIKFLIELSIDTRQTLEKDKNVKFYVNTQSFDILEFRQVMAVPNMLEQSLTCLLDNAGKYSFPNTYVDISGSIYQGKEKSYFIVSVKNRGILIQLHELEKCKERKYRGDNVKGVVGEGAGIGLWITNQVMLAHGGKVIIQSDSRSNITEVKLLFPIIK